MTMIDMMNKNSKAPSKLGLYIHIPFCRTKCLYCDFCSFVSRDDREREAYVCALLDEIEARGTREYTVDTVYFGGGTPSLLSAEQIGRILSAVRESFVLDGDVEITLECNPMIGRDVEGAVPYGALEYFADLKKIGVNRLSIGVQSAVAEELKLIGRRHSFDDAKDTFLAARGAGFENISVDLMFGIPSQTSESLETSIDAVLSLGAEHISIYSLQLEEGTPLHRMREKYVLADEDAVADMYELIVRRMKDAGYSHYEISNFARRGRESRHNSKYWRLEPYIGLGIAAHSDFLGKRVENTNDMNKYLAGDFVESKCEIGRGEREFEFIMLGLRTGAGISKAEFLERFGVDFDEKYGKRVENLQKMGYFNRNDDVLSLSESGFEVSNSILEQILDFDY